MFNTIANNYERAGKPVIVAENGYVGIDENNHHLFALALDHHNGAGRYPVGCLSRWYDFNIPLKPWITERGRDLLLLPQRGIGPPGVAMPRNWLSSIQSRLASQRRFIRIRKHPGTAKNAKPLTNDFKGVYMCVTWASGAGIKAIIEGMPVFHELSDWVGRDAATRDINKPYTGDRSVMLARVAWSQWRIDEIATGEPFDNLLIYGGYKKCV